jgi:hypothetical protein
MPISAPSLSGGLPELGGAGVSSLVLAHLRPKCCRATAASSPDAAFCDQCGSAILRCAAYDECGGLVDATGFCPSCFNLELFLDAGAVRQAKVGSSMALPLIVRNAGKHDRALFITELWVRQGTGERVRQQLPWERINAGQSAPWTVQTQPLDQEGRQNFEVILVAASRTRWREEKFALAANMEIGVEDDGQVVINQTINVQGGEVAGAGHTVYAPIRIDGDSRRAEAAASNRPAPLALTRADGFERDHGLRGTPQGRVDRTVRLEWKGFAADEAGPAGPILTPDGMLALGRSRLKSRGGVNDVRLLVRDTAGRLDETLSEEVSRRHIDLFVQNGALCVRASGQAGLRVTDQGLRQGEVVALADGDRIFVLPRRATAVALDVRFEAHHGVVEQVTFTRVPAAPRDVAQNNRAGAGR